MRDASKRKLKCKLMAGASMVKCTKKWSGILNHNVFGQMPKSSSKVLFELDFFMATFIIVLGIQI